MLYTTRKVAISMGCPTYTAIYEVPHEKWPIPWVYIKYIAIYEVPHKKWQIPRVYTKYITIYEVLYFRTFKEPQEPNYIKFGLIEQICQLHYIKFCLL